MDVGPYDKASSSGIEVMKIMLNNQKAAHVMQLSLQSHDPAPECLSAVGEILWKKKR